MATPQQRTFAAAGGAIAAAAALTAAIVATSSSPTPEPTPATVPQVSILADAGDAEVRPQDRRSEWQSPGFWDGYDPDAEPRDTFERVRWLLAHPEAPEWKHAKYPPPKHARPEP